ncbi:hypothetical protein P692DRAFT_20530875 [Suillus brevipes Sb2]|nr:hypothetical protein P692DRAFT_20530875 [Suillus brevipes Sb2]
MAWLFSFPTFQPQEQFLRRMSAVAITFTPWLFLLVLFKPIAVPMSMVRLVRALICLASHPGSCCPLGTHVYHFTQSSSRCIQVVSWTSPVPHL